MRQAFFVLLGAIIIASCNNSTGWPAKDRNDFISNCTQAAAANIGAEKAKAYCTCMQQKMEKKFPDPKDAAKITDATMQSPEMQAMAKECLGDNTGNTNTGNPIGNPYGGNNGNNNNNEGWSDADVQKFMNTCLQNAMNAGADEQTSNQHCNCVLKKIEKKYKNFDDANRNMSKQEVDAIEQECLEERRNGNQ